MKRSAGAPLSICLASALLAAYEILGAGLPLAFAQFAAASSSAFFMLAAAKTTTP